MNEKRESTLGTLVMVLNFTVLICLLSFGYLLFGNYIANWTKKTPIATNSALHKSKSEDDFDKVVNGIHLQSGLVYAQGFDVVRGTCTACHSAKLVTQNRASREGWEQMIRWMQKTQGLWDLGTNEPIILDYLAAHYAPEEIGRRANLDMEAIEWFILELDED